MSSDNNESAEGEFIGADEDETLNQEVGGMFSAIAANHTNDANVLDLASKADHLISGGISKHGIPKVGIALSLASLTIFGVAEYVNATKKQQNKT